MRRQGAAIRNATHVPHRLKQIDTELAKLRDLLSTMHVEIAAAPSASGALTRSALALSLSLTMLELILANFLTDQELA